MRHVDIRKCENASGDYSSEASTSFLPELRQYQHLGCPRQCEIGLLDRQLDSLGLPVPSLQTEGPQPRQPEPLAFEGPARAV
jgi:hypothetical protein